jgi:hypothetical protein
LNFLGNAYASLANDGNLDVRSVAQKSAVISLRESLEKLNKWKISYSVRNFWLDNNSLFVSYMYKCRIGIYSVVQGKRDSKETGS